MTLPTSPPFRLACGVLLIGLVACFVSLPPKGQAEETLVRTSSSRKLPDQVTFNAHIRPLMSNTCFTCHGPDEEENESEFRIDSFATATGPLPSDEDRRGIVPGDPEASEVYLRITDRGDGEMMPPESFRHRLSDFDKALIRRWIEQGAPYEQHWSYAPIRKVTPPDVRADDQPVSHPIDAFVQARLRETGLNPSPLADRATLLRRLSLDLTGLPPTIDEIENFLSDDSPNAYAKQVDRLLDSPHYGEQMATDWLDIIRFADTVGFHGDQNMRNYPYRDYVIDAFNKNKPFDAFTVEQLAGDLLPNPTPEQLTATAALRLNMVTREGGAQPGEYLAKYRADRVRMLGTAWLGSTLACCECHNHKYDPFSAKDFYSFGAFFDDMRQWGVYSDYGYTPNADLRGYNNDYPFPPEMRVESESARQTIRALQQQRDRSLAAQGGDRDKVLSWRRDVEAFLEENPGGWHAMTPERVRTSAGTKAAVNDDRSVRLEGPAQKSETLAFAFAPQGLPPVRSVRLEVLPDPLHAGSVGRGEDGRFRLQASFAIEANQGAGGPRPPKARYVRVELPGNRKILSLAEVEVFARDQDGALQNIAPRGKATQSSRYKTGPPELAIDGNREGDYYEGQSVTHTDPEGDHPWWEVDLGEATVIESLKLWNRTDHDYAKRLSNYRVVLLDAERRELFVDRPATPNPSIDIAVPEQVTPAAQTQAWKVAYAAADRRDPQRFRSGYPTPTLGDTWRSGPARWQLPEDEHRLPHTAIYHFEQPRVFTADQRLVVRLESGDVGRVRISVSPFGDPVAGWPATPEAIAEGRDKPSGDSADEAWQAAYHLAMLPARNQHRDAKRFRDEILDLHSGMAMTVVTQALPAEQIVETRLLPRGDWQDETGPLTPPGFPKFLPQPPRDSERRLNRLDLARWVVSPENPLTPRHFVNRLWSRFFGAGLSGKLDDLGNQGEWPSHPQLLDWLAAEFVDRGWDVKHLVRLIVTSQTYRQAAGVRPELQDVDPYNRLLAQQSPRRLEAESVRDNALAIAGLLRTDIIGGPSVFPYQPGGHYSNLQFPNRRYQADDDFRQYRRGVYMHWQRTFLHPMLVNFDAPSRDECAADRAQSNSPQQALTLLNDPSFVEASAALAVDLSNDDRDFDERLEEAFLRAVARPPAEAEAAALRKLLQRQTEYFAKHPADAQSSLGRLAEAIPPDRQAEQAAWTQVCRVILNLHETITRY